MKAKLLALIIIVFFAYKAWGVFSEEEIILDFSNSAKTVTVNDNGLTFKLHTKTNSVEDLLRENGLNLKEYDQLIPSKESLIIPGANIEIKRAVKIKISADGKTLEDYTVGKTVSAALHENKIVLTRLDKISPDLDYPVQNNLIITVTRINVEETAIQEDINFKTIVKTDKKMGWREKEVETPGELGIREVVYKITYKDGKEISRVALSKKTIRDPVPQTETQGTYMELKKAARGQATWYAYQGGMFAASTTIPKGNYAKVTNTANGKSIVVQINDYGPQGKGRVIDLDKVAFAKIASLGAGVIGVKVEEILN